MNRPGRKRVGSLFYRKRGLSSDARIILALLKKQPQSIDDLCKNASIPRQTQYRVLPTLKDLGIIVETQRGYALGNYKDAEEAVIKAIEKWRIMGFRDPDPREIADEVNLSTEDAEAFARKTKDKTGWVTPNEGVKENAMIMLGETYGARVESATLASQR